MRVATDLPQLNPETRPVLTIEEAGQYLGMGRAAAYMAAKGGYLPTINVSPGRRVVPTAALRRMLQLDGSGDRMLPLDEAGE